MCTLIAVRGRHPRYPLVVGANRDEFYRRPASPPRIWPEPGPRVQAPRTANPCSGLRRPSTPRSAPPLLDDALHRLVTSSPTSKPMPRRYPEHELRVRVLAPRDELAGGTWMGANDAGLFVGLTNQRTHRPADRTRRSRGEVVLSLLREPSVEHVVARLEQLDPADYNDFNLLFGDHAALHVAYSRAASGRIEVQALGDGVWVLPNDRLGSPDFPKARRAAARVERLAPDTLFPEGLTSVLADPSLPPRHAVPEPPADSVFDHDLAHRLQALCIHTPLYGTRSAMLLALGERGVERYLFADGAPCDTDFKDYSSLLRA